MFNESTTQNTTNDKSFLNNFNLVILIIKQLQEKNDLNITEWLREKISRERGSGNLFLEKVTE